MLTKQTLSTENAFTVSLQTHAISIFLNYPLNRENIWKLIIWACKEIMRVSEFEKRSFFIIILDRVIPSKLHNRIDEL